MNNLKPNAKGIVTINEMDENGNINLSDLNNKKIKKVIVNANEEDNDIIGSKYLDIIYSNSGVDKINAGKGNDKIYGNSAGNKTFVFSKGDGNDKLYNVKNGDTIELNVDTDIEDVKAIRNGNNLVVTYVPQIKNKKNKIVQKSDSITLVDFFLEDEDHIRETNIQTLKIGENTLDLGDLYYNNELQDMRYMKAYEQIFGTSFPKKGFKGSAYNDIINGTKNADLIMSGGGNDIITPNKGNDVIIASNGETTINIENGDGNDKIFTFENGIINLKYNSDDTITAKEEDGTVTVSRIYDSGSDIKVEETTFNKILGSEGILKINDEVFDENDYITNIIRGNYNQQNPNLNNDTDNNAIIIGGKKNDIITGGQNLTNIIYSSAGDDKLYLYKGVNIVDAGKGKDIITVHGGNNDLRFKNGDGNDTIEFDLSDDIENVNINLLFDKNAVLSYRADEDALYIDRTFKNGKKKVTETLTIKFKENQFDLTNTGNLLENIFVRNRSLIDLINESGLNIKGFYDKEFKETIYYGHWNVNNKITYNTNGNAYMLGGSKDDSYIINALNNKTGVIELDEFDGEDSVNIKSNAKNLRLMFNVDYQGNVVNNNEYWSEENNFEHYWYNALLIFDKSLLTLDNYNKIKENSKGYATAKGVLMLDNYFMNGENYSIENSFFEHISSKDSNGIDIDIKDAVKEIAQKVAEYLALTEFDTAYELMENGTKAQKNALLNIYKNTILGTDGNNSFTTTKNNDIFISGKGNDTFTFSGKFGNDIIVSNSEFNYESNPLNTDTIVFKDYALSKGSLNIGYELGGYDEEGTPYLTNNLLFTVMDNKGYLHTVTYKNFFSHTLSEENIKSANVKIKDKTSTYNIDYRKVDNADYSVSYSDEKAVKNKTNVKVLFLENDFGEEGENKNKNTVTSSSVGYHIINTNNGADTTFNYKNGHDQYLANSELSDDTYNIDIFNKNTDLFIYDYAGDDSINFKNSNIGDLRILFNVNSDGTYGSSGDYFGEETRMQIFHKDRFNVNDIVYMLVNNKRQGLIQIEDFIQEGGEASVEHFSIGGENVNINDWMGSIAQEVSGWLRSNGFTSTLDAMQGVSTVKQFNSLLQAYNVSYDSLNL